MDSDTAKGQFDHYDVVDAHERTVRVYVYAENWGRQVLIGFDWIAECKLSQPSNGFDFSYHRHDVHHDNSIAGTEHDHSLS